MKGADRSVPILKKKDVIKKVSVESCRPPPALVSETKGQSTQPYEAQSSDEMILSPPGNGHTTVFVCSN